MTDRYGHPRQTIFGRRHASAVASVSYSTSQHPQQQAQHQPPPPSSSTATQGLGMSSSSAAAAILQQPARRNLFQCQLTRRPPPGKGGAGADDGDEDTVVADEECDDDDDGGIVVRGARGEVELDEPPCLAVDDPDEIVLDMRQENESACPPPPFSTGIRGLRFVLFFFGSSFLNMERCLTFSVFACLFYRGATKTCGRSQAAPKSAEKCSCSA